MGKYDIEENQCVYLEKADYILRFFSLFLDIFACNIIRNGSCVSLIYENRRFIIDRVVALIDE